MSSLGKERSSLAKMSMCIKSCNQLETNADAQFYFELRLIASQEGSTDGFCLDAQCGSRNSPFYNSASTGNNPRGNPHADAALATKITDFVEL